MKYFTKKKKRIFWAIIILIGLIAFGVIYLQMFQVKTYRMNNQNAKASFTLQKVGQTKGIVLDEYTDPHISDIQLVTINDSIFITFLNYSKQRIYWYDFQSQKMLYHTPLEKEGVNGVGMVVGYKIITKDSIFAYNYGTGQLYVLNQKGLLKHKLGSFFPEKELPAKYYCSPWGRDGAELMPYKGKLYGTTFSADPKLPEEDSLNRPILASFDIDSKQIKSYLGYPSVFREAFWGGIQMHQVYSTLVGTKIVIGFTISPLIYVYDIETKQVHTHYAGSSFATEIHSMSASDIYKKGGKSKHYLSNPSYENILYDPYRKLYYRMLRLPSIENDIKIKEKEKLIKPLVVIILDENFKYIGEFRPERVEYGSNASFVSPEGLHLVKLPLNQEDMLMYDTFIPKKIQ
jgi:hypothetical protein